MIPNLPVNLYRCMRHFRVDRQKSCYHFEVRISYAEGKMLPHRQFQSGFSHHEAWRIPAWRPLSIRRLNPEPYVPVSEPLPVSPHAKAAHHPHTIRDFLATFHSVSSTIRNAGSFDTTSLPSPSINCMLPSSFPSALCLYPDDLYKPHN